MTATSKMGKMIGGGQELGEAKVQGGGEEPRGLGEWLGGAEGVGADFLAEGARLLESGERRDRRWILVRGQVGGLVS